jgi:membrane-associated phospholipid phosphatase
MMSVNVYKKKYPPLNRIRVITRLIGGGLLVIIGLLLVGLGIVHLWTPSVLTRWDDRSNTWFYLHRTPTLNSLTNFGGSLGGAPICIGLMAVMFIVFRLWFKRWRESWTVFAALVGQPIIFLSVEMIVKRPRPNVPHLGVAPPSFSFPSGHVAAALVLYGCIAIIVWRQLQVRWLAMLIAVVCWAIPFVVAYSRMYRGMHHPSDVIAAFIGFGLWLCLILTTLLPSAKPEADLLRK